MTEPQIVFAEIETFRAEIQKLSAQLDEDRDFWPAFAELANEIEGPCPLELRDYARDSIRRIARSVRSARERPDGTPTHLLGAYA